MNASSEVLPARHSKHYVGERGENSSTKQGIVEDLGVKYSFE